MNVRLQALLAEAEAVLPEDEQDALADMIEDFMAGEGSGAILSPEEMAQIDRIAAEPFVEADPERVAALFARRG